MRFVKLFEEFEKQLLTEKASVPKAIIPYAEDLSEKIYEVMVRHLERGKHRIQEEETFTYDKVLDEDFPLSEVDMVISYQVIEDLKSKHKKPEKYDGLVIEGGYIGGSNLVKTEAGFRVNMQIDMYLGDDFVRNKGYENKEFVLEKIQALLFHELLHAYEDTKRKTKHGKQIADSSMQAYVASSTHMRRQGGVPEPVSMFLFLVYASAAFEVSARNSAIWPKIRKTTDPREREKIVKNTEQWEIADMLEKFNYKEMLKEIKEDIKRANIALITFGDTPIDPDSTIRELIRDMKKTYINVSKQLAERSLIKARETSKLSIDFDIDKIKGDVKKNFDKIRSISTDPEKFFKAWETRFHIMGRKAKRKMSKMITAEQE